MMDGSADDLLERARRGCAGWLERPEYSDTYTALGFAEDLARNFGALDALLSSGGPLPTAWAVPAGRAVQDVPLPRRVPGTALAAVDDRPQVQADERLKGRLEAALTRAGRAEGERDLLAGKLEAVHWALKGLLDGQPVKTAVNGGSGQEQGHPAGGKVP